jgi:hypothetical protein
MHVPSMCTCHSATAGTVESSAGKGYTDASPHARDSCSWGIPSIEHVKEAPARDVNVVGDLDTNITQLGLLFDIADCLQSGIIISLVINNSECESNVVTWRATIPRSMQRCAI